MSEETFEALLALNPRVGPWLDARVICWVLKQAARRFQGVSGSFD